MPSISNVHLDIEKGKGGDRRKVTVTYRLCFTACEILAGSVFVEKTILRGNDPIWDDNLVTLRNQCVKASKDCIDRSIVRHVSRRTLDEDGDTIIFGIPIFADQDELYAHVTLTPFVPNTRTANSNEVRGQFGAAGND